MAGEEKTGSGTRQKLPQGNQPPNPEGTDKATKDNDLTTGHSTPGDGGDDNAKRHAPTVGLPRADANLSGSDR